MRTLLLLSGLVLTAGCDDPAVRDRIDSILDHGAVVAEATCAGVIDTSPPTGHNCNGSFPFTVKYDLFIDSSSIVSLSSNGDYITKFSGRGDQGVTKFCHSVPPVVNGPLCFELHDGLLELHSVGSCNPTSSTPPEYSKVYDIDVACTGFNLEAFE